MDADGFRALALALSEVIESAHQGHPDFRVGGKVFATLGPDGDWGMVNLPPDRQAALTRAQPAVFESFAGAWGAQGCTRVHLEGADEPTVRDALDAAWHKIAPRGLSDDGERGS